MKKTLKITSLLLAVFLSFGVCACGGNNASKNDPKVITVKTFKAGYGTAWLYKAKEKFEELYKDEGYKVNILKPDNSLQGSAALADMRNAKKLGVDVYFVQSVSIANALDKEYGECVADISDVYASRAIGFDGAEENVTIANKLSDTYDSAVKLGNNYYSMLWASSPCGLIANTKVLAKYGLELPKTTDELFACFKAIYEGANGQGGSSSTGVYPFAWAGQNAYGYALYSLYANLGQMLGQDETAKFLSLQQGATVTENDVKNGKSMYNSDDVFAPIEIMMKEFNTATSVPGSVNAIHTTGAQYNLLSGKCAFIADGEFFFSETKNDYGDRINDVAFINVPVASDLGVKLQLDGDGNDRAKCDVILSYVIGLVDQNKTAEEIIFAVSDKGYEISVEQIEQIAEARGCFYERKDHNAYISKYSEKADIAKLFLRMVASDDFGDLFNETAYAYAPYSRRNDIESDYAFVNDCFKLVKRSNAWGISRLDVTGLRQAANVGLYNPYGEDIVRKLCDSNVLYSTNDKSSKSDFVKVREEIRKNIADHWNEKMTNAGYNV